MTLYDKLIKRFGGLFRRMYKLEVIGAENVPKDGCLKMRLKVKQNLSHFAKWVSRARASSRLPLLAQASAAATSSAIVHRL